MQSAHVHMSSGALLGTPNFGGSFHSTIITAFLHMVIQLINRCINRCQVHYLSYRSAVFWEMN